jgi:hypothetical protein
MGFEIKAITDKIVHLEFETQIELARSLCRIQEYYESPQFKGKIFTLGQYREWYSQQNGAWTYYEDWSGFNLPDHVFKPFIQGLFDPLSPEEQKIVDLFRFRTGQFYVIATAKDSTEKDSFAHEMSHALFYTDDDYSHAVLGHILGKKELVPLRRHLRSLGYNELVITDECQAYLTESTEYLDKEGIEYPKAIAAKLKLIKAKFTESM